MMNRWLSGKKEGRKRKGLDGLNVVHVVSHFEIWGRLNAHIVRKGGNDGRE
jgi:hypothetical protein